VTLVLVGVVLPWIVIVVAGWIGFRMMGQHGRMMQLIDELDDEVEELQAERTKAPPGLPAGSAAPPFELPNLAGHRTSLEQFRGRPVLLVFFSPECGFCQEMAPQIAALPWDGADGRPVPILISTGDVEKHRAFMEQHDIRCPVLLQENEGPVATLYGAEGTPVGYLIDEQGLLISGVTEGADDLLALADPKYVPPAPGSQAGGPRVSTPTWAGSGVEGLRVGALAPAFRLPRLDGGELSLEDYRGRRLLLVFSDPECEPCDALMPELERLQRAGTGVEVAIVARGTARANRAKVKQYGLSFPVALQRDWEISRLYRKPGVTPSGYLIDAGGRIAADMAVGGDQVLTLMAERDVAARESGDARSERGGR
jgi:peroxiredoxin